jgi:hypothetical protein
MEMDTNTIELHEKVRRYEALLFARGAMLQVRYNGPGYFQPKQHACAQQHHDLYKPGI